MSYKQDRYQYQSWYIKLWRLRWYLYIPIDILFSYLHDLFLSKSYKESLHNKWSIAVGMAQLRMNWVYDLEEVCDEILQQRSYRDKN